MDILHNYSVTYKPLSVVTSMVPKDSNAWYVNKSDFHIGDWSLAGDVIWLYRKWQSAIKRNSQTDSKACTNGIHVDTNLLIFWIQDTAVRNNHYIVANLAYVFYAGKGVDLYGVMIINNGTTHQLSYT